MIVWLLMTLSKIYGRKILTLPRCCNACICIICTTFSTAIFHTFWERHFSPRKCLHFTLWGRLNFQHVVENYVENSVEKKFSTSFNKVFNSFNTFNTACFSSNINQISKKEQTFNSFNISTFHSLLKTFQKLQKS